MANYKDGVGNYKTSSGGSATTIKKQIDDLTVNNSTTLVSTDLVTPTLAVGKSYEIICWISSISGTTPDEKFKWLNDTLVSDVSVWEITFNAYAYPNNAITVTKNVNGTGSLNLRQCILILINVTTAGTLTMQYAQQVANASNSVIHKGSTMRVTEY